jgi:hypothetical protein
LRGGSLAFGAFLAGTLAVQAQQMGAPAQSWTHAATTTPEALQVTPAPGVKTGQLTEDRRGTDTARRAALRAQIERFSTAQLRVLGTQALPAGRYDIAQLVVEALRRRVPDDSFAPFLEAQILLRTGRPDAARTTARLAFERARTPIQKHEAARLAALSAARADRFLPAQVWMRRALQAAPDEVSRADAAHAFRAMRQRARLSFRDDLEVTPTDNVNGGASEEVFVVDGMNLVGTLSPDAMALSGVITRGALHLGYRLHQSESSVTRMRGYAQVQRVRLSNEAQDDAPMAENETYGHTVFDIGLLHHRRLSPGGPALTVTGDVGQGWFGGAHSYDVVRGNIALRQPVSPRTDVTLSYGHQLQWDPDGTNDDITSVTWRVGLSHVLANDDRVSATVFAGEILTDETRSARTLQGLSLRYTKAAPIGPISLSGRLSGQKAHYPDDPVLFGLTVPGGREDTRLSASLEFGFEDVSYMGFIPTLTVRHETTTSNVSRFETRGTTLSLGFRSEF